MTHAKCPCGQVPHSVDLHDLMDGVSLAGCPHCGQWLVLFQHPSGLRPHLRQKLADEAWNNADRSWAEPKQTSPSIG